MLETRQNWVKKDDGTMELLGEKVEDITEEVNADSGRIREVRIVVSEWGTL